LKLNFKMERVKLYFFSGKKSEENNPCQSLASLIYPIVLTVMFFRRKTAVSSMSPASGIILFV
jgi:hypothetical protein